ncbi:hypothetical protein FKM82_024627 [Ascaphus truei]
MSFDELNNCGRHLLSSRDCCFLASVKSGIRMGEGVAHLWIIPLQHVTPTYMTTSNTPKHIKTFKKKKKICSK